jgi:hypothetical protein
MIQNPKIENQVIQNQVENLIKLKEQLQKEQKTKMELIRNQKHHQKQLIQVNLTKVEMITNPLKLDQVSTLGTFFFGFFVGMVIHR